MPIGTAGAIIGSSLIGAGASLFGSRSANRAAQQNAQRAQENINAANQGVYQSLDPAYEYWQRGADTAAGYLGQGYNNLRNLYQPITNEYFSGRGQMYAADSPNINPNISQNATFRGNPNIDNTWGDINSQNALSNFYESPDYQYRQNEALNAVQNSAAAQGGLYSGNTLKDITQTASNMAGAEFGNWFNRQQGLGDREYGRQADNYGRSAGQFADNYSRNYGQAIDNYNRAYGAGIDERNFNYGRGLDLANIGLGGISAQAGNDSAYYNNLANIYGGVEDRRGQSIIRAGENYANNLVHNAGIQAQTPYVSPYGGLNNAIQGGLQNYLWAQNAGMWGNTGAKPGAGAPGNYLYGMA